MTRILFAGKQHFNTGGIESSTDQLARRLLARGHDVESVSGPPPRSGGDEEGRPRLEDLGRFEYPAWSAVRMPPAEALRRVMRQFGPDVVIVNAGGDYWHDWTRSLVMATDAVPCVLYLHDRRAVDLLTEPALRPDAVWSCAHSHAAVARATTGYDVEIVPYLVEPELYRVDPTGEIALFINPVKSKGVRTAITLAASRPDVPFVFLRSYNLRDSYLLELHNITAALGNVEVLAPTPTPRDLYARSRLLLVPYDDFGRPRVIAEAQVSGIPALAFDEAGHREAVGPGGLFVAGDAPMSAWVDGLGRLWDDDVEHRRLGAAALDYSRRPEMDPERIVAAVEQGLDDVIARAQRTGARRDARTGANPRLVSVILPVRNAASTIDDQLAALAAQTYDGRWELVIADNGSTDGSRARALAWTGGFPAKLRLVDASARRGVAHARNAGMRAARGEYVLICDADDVVSPEWIQHMVDALHDHDIVTGIGELRLLNAPDQYEWTGDADQFDASVGYHHRRYASGGNLGVRRDVAIALAGFDETMRRAEDIDWSWRAQNAGYDIGFAPEAVIHLRMQADLRAVASKAFRGGYTIPLLYRRHAQDGMRAQSREEVFEVWRWLAGSTDKLRKQPDFRNQWVDHAAQRAGRIVGSIRHRSWFF